MKAILRLSLLLLLQLLVPQLLRAMSIPPSDKDLKAPQVSSREATLSWTRVKPGPAVHKSLVVLQLISGRAATTPKPVESVAYIANQYFGLGQQIGAGEFVVYADTGRVVVVKGLTPGATYRADVIAYEAESDFYRAPGYTKVEDRDTTATLFFTTAPPTKPAAPTPASAPQATALDCSTLQLSCRPGQGDGRLLVVQAVSSRADGASKPTAPTNDIYYLASQNYGQGQTVGPDAYVVQLGADTAFTAYKLPPGGLYKFIVYEYAVEKDAAGNPVADGSITYATATDTAYVQVTSCGTSEPERPATNARQTDTTLTTARVVWRNGSGQGRLVVVREFTQGLLTPVQNTVYQANATYGLGDQTHPGSYVVLTGQDSVINLTGLQPASLYQLEVYEYNLAPDGQPTYLLSQQPASTVVMTAFPPVPGSESADKLRMGFAQAFTYDRGLVQLHWKQGNGSHYLVLIREVRDGRAPLPTPVEWSSYPSSSQHRQIMDERTHIGGGVYVLSNEQYLGPEDTITYLRNAQIGHVYEVALTEYTLNFMGEPEYSTPTSLTFVAPRFAPSLSGQLDGMLPLFTWQTAALYLPDTYELEYSSDGENFLPNGNRQDVGMDSSVTQVKGKERLAVPLTAPTFYRLRLLHRDQHSEYSNVVRLEPARPLPVTLTSFKGKVDGRSFAHLTWATAAEVNSDYFELQRSEDGTRFSSVGRRPAAGSSTAVRAYELQDPTQLTVPTYYRLRQVDRDSTAHYSGVLTLQPVVQPSVTLTVWPNPVGADQQAHLRLSGLKDRESAVEIAIYTVHGKLVRRHKLPAAPVVDWSWSLEQFPAGLYLVEVRSSAGRHTARLVVE